VRMPYATKGTLKYKGFRYYVFSAPKKDLAAF